MPDIDEICRSFGRIYDKHKEVTTTKRDRQSNMFAAFTQALEQKRLPRKTIEIPDVPEDLDEWVTVHHPGWRITSTHDAKMIIERDPALMKHTHIDRIDGKVYGRTETREAPSLNETRLLENDPDLWMSITQWPEPWYSIIRGCLPADDLSQADEILEAHGIDRVLKDPSTWTEKQAAAVQQYMVPGAISVKLVPPRKATKEEMES